MDLDEAERHVLRATSGYAPDGDVVISRAALRRYASEFEEDRAALADAQAEIARLRPYLDKAQAHTCPAPDWYLKVRDLLGDVVLAAAFAGTDLADLPEHVRDLHAEVARLRAADEQRSLLAATVVELAERIARLRAAVIEQADEVARQTHVVVSEGQREALEGIARELRALAAAPAPAEDEEGVK